MPDLSTKPSVKSAAIGALAGAAVFFALSAVRAQAVLTVQQLHSNVRPFVGSTVQVTGLVQNVRTQTRSVGGQQVEFTMLNLYEQDSKGRKKEYYVYVSLPTSQFQTPPMENQMMTVTGPLKWGYMFAAIDP